MTTTLAPRRVTELSWRQRAGPWGPLALLGLVIVLVYWPALDGEMLWDDADQFAEVPELREPTGFLAAWRPLGSAQYYPLSLTVFWALHQVFGQWPPAFHGLNLLLHLGNTALLWVILTRIDRRFAIWGAAFFGLHPVLVQAVAWMCQLRNCLSLQVALWSVLAWVWYEETGALRWRRWSIGLYVAAMLSKTAIAPLPAALWIFFQAVKPRRGRLVELLPMAAAGVALSLVTIVYEWSAAAHGERFVASWSERMARLGWIAWFHLWHAVIPYPTNFVYYRWPIPADRWQSFVPLAAGVVFLAGALAWDRRHRVGLGLCLLCYLVMLFPVLGLFNVYFMRYSWVADHWQYPAMPFLAAGLVLALARLAARGVPRELIGTAMLIVLAAFAALAHQRARLFADQGELWRDTLAKNPHSWLAHNNYGVLLETERQPDQALHHYLEAYRIDPRAHETLNNLARLARQRNDLAAAEAHLRQAVALEPRREYGSNLASLLIHQGRHVEAERVAREAIAANPQNASARGNLGAALEQQGRLDEALAEYREALRIAPELEAPRMNLVRLLTQRGEAAEAIPHFEQLVAQSPRRAELRFGLASALAAQGRAREAVEQYREALALAPQWAAPATNLAILLGTHPDPGIRDLQQAVALAERAVHLTGEKDAGTWQNLAVCYAQAGRLNDAKEAARRALALSPPAAQREAIQRLLERIEAAAGR